MRKNQTMRGLYSLILLGLMMFEFTGVVWGKPNQIISALNMVPVDAPIAIVVPSLSTLNDKAAQLNQQALGSSVPPLNDLLGTIKGMLGIPNGLNDDGSLILMVTDAQALNQDGPEPVDPPAIMLIPVTDYAQFVAQLGGNADEAVTRIRPMAPVGDEGAFIKKLANYAVIGPTHDQVAAFQPAQSAREIILRAGKAGSRCLSTSDAVILVNVESLEPVIRPQIQIALDQATQELQQMPEMSEALKRFTQAAVSIYGDSAIALLRDTTSVVVGLDLTPQGVGLSYTAQFKEGSHLAQIFSTGAGVTDQLSTLSNQDYWLASAMNFSGVHLDTLTKDLMARFSGEEDNPMSDLIQHVATLLQQTKGMATIYTLPDQFPMMGGSLINGILVYETKDAKAYTQSIRDYFDTMQVFLDQISPAHLVDPNGPNGQPNLNAPPPEVKVTYTPDALQIDGASVDEYQIQYQLPPEVMQQMGPMFMMMGGTGQQGYIASKGPYVVMTTSRDPLMIKKALAAIGQPNGLDSNIPLTKVRLAGLPSNTVMEGYLNLSGIVKAVNMFIAMMGQPPLEVPQNLQPIAMAASVENHGIMARWYVPTEVIKFCKDAVDQATAKFGGQDGGPAGGPPPGGPQRQGPPPAPF